MDNLLVPVTVGTALVLIIDFIRKVFPKLTITQIKLITVFVSVLFAALTYFSQTNQVVGEGLKIFLIILGTSQILYSLVWKDTEVHKDITNG